MLAAAALLLAGPAATPPPPADPLTVVVHSEDADRFAALFDLNAGRPTTAQLQAGYLDPGSYGVRVFLADRIVDAGHLARAVAHDRDAYATAIRDCLPIARAATATLRSTYLAYAGLFPDKPLPQVYLVFGAGNSGGTAGLGTQVLGLEVLCRVAPTRAKLDGTLRAFFAHETAHSWQDADHAAPGEPLLAAVLVEGAADFLATLVDGRQIDPDRAAWGLAHEPTLWAQFEADLALTRGAGDADLRRGRPAGEAMHRWVGNAGEAPAGWPGEAGYWIGQRIWERWWVRQPDKHVAVRRLLTLDRLDDVLAAGRYRRADATGGRAPEAVPTRTLPAAPALS